MAALLVVSGFFSGSEAAFFSLTPSQRRTLGQGNQIDRSAEALAAKSERLLMGILFWNLAINIGFFTLASKLAILASETIGSTTIPAVVTVTSLLCMILCGEFLPKTFAVSYPMLVVRTVVLPLAAAVRLLDVIIPAIQFVNEYSRRLIWPGFKSEPYLELQDLDRAVELSTQDARLYEQEQQVLRNVIRLSDIRVEEWMRPRTQYLVFTPPLSLDQLGGIKTPSGYMLVTDSAGSDITHFIDFNTLNEQDVVHLDDMRQELEVVPWCATIADALNSLKTSRRRVAVIVNEFGESIGVLTWEEIIEAILQSASTPSQRELSKAEIRPIGTNLWLATGMTKLRRLEHVLDISLSTSRGLTVAGMLQEELHRLPEAGDECVLHGLKLTVIEAALRGEILVQVEKQAKEEVE